MTAAPMILRYKGQLDQLDVVLGLVELVESPCRVSSALGANHPQFRDPFGPSAGRCHCPIRQQQDELAPLHSIVSSASESRLSEILMPSALAVLRLITVSNLVGCSTGRSAGFAPLRIFAV